MQLGPHAGFIVAAYLVAIAIVAALLGWIVMDRRQLRRELAELEASGVSRRSEAAKRPPA